MFQEKLLLFDEYSTAPFFKIMGQKMDLSCFSIFKITKSDPDLRQ